MPNPVGLSVKAQEIIKAFEVVHQDPRTIGFLEEYKGQKWLPMDNILNGHVEAPEDYKDKLDPLCLFLNEHLIDSNGHHSKVFYELKTAGYSVRTGEWDAFGPLSAIMKCPFDDWFVSYG